MPNDRQIVARGTIRATPCLFPIPDRRDRKPINVSKLLLRKTSRQSDCADINAVGPMNFKTVAPGPIDPSARIMGAS